MTICVNTLGSSNVLYIGALATAHFRRPGPERAKELDYTMKLLKTTKTRFIYIGRMFKILWQNDKPFIFIIIGSLIFSSILPFIGMYLIKYSIDMLTQGDIYSEYLTTVVILLAATCIVTMLHSFFHARADSMGIRICHELFNNIFGKSMELNYEMLLDKQIMEKRELAMKVIEQGRFKSLINNFRFFAMNVIVMAGIIYIVSSIEWWILIIVLAIVVINSVSSVIRKNKERTWDVARAELDRKVMYFININTDTAMGKEIRTYTMQRPLNTIYKNLLALLEGFMKKATKIGLRSENISTMTTMCLNLVIYLYLGYKIMVLHTISIGDFSLFLSAIGTFNKAIQDMVESYIDISNNGVYLKDYFDYMGLKSRFDAEGVHTPTESNSDCTFVFENVGFKYPYQETYSLKDINLTLTSKERLAIVGENGAAKPP
jgi:ABC-type multidrug transport system fused ATPase/permease subunit